MQTAVTSLVNAGFAAYVPENEVWAPTFAAYDAMQLADFNLHPSRLDNALVPQFFYLIEADTEWFHPEERVKKLFERELNVNQVKLFWGYIGTIVASLANDDARLVGTDLSGGLVLDVLSVEAREDWGSERVHVSFAGRPKTNFAANSAILDIRLPPPIQKNDVIRAVDLVKWPH